MKKLFTSVVTFLCLSTLVAQHQVYEKGYFIDNKNTKVDCLIKNEDWEYNPNQFEYKFDLNSESKIIKMSDFSEFSVDEYRFKKVTVKIDKSSDSYEKVTSVKACNFVEQELLIRVLIEGNANLYSFKTDNYARYFYAIKGDDIKPLTYKIYFDEDQKVNSKNETYKQELLNSLKCDKISQKDIDRLLYIKSKLVDLFERYNLCTGAAITEYKTKMNFKTFEGYAKLGFGVSSFSYSNGSDANFDKKARFKVGFEAEINLSNKEKRWSLLIEPCYQQYTNSYTFKNNASHADINYKGIDISFGIKRYLQLNSNSYFFADANYTYGMTLNSKVDLSNNPNSLTISKTLNPSLGLGYLCNKKYSLEIRYEFNRNLFDNYNYVDSKFSTIGLIVGYKLL